VRQKGKVRSKDGLSATEDTSDVLTAAGKCLQLETNHDRLAVRQ